MAPWCSVRSTGWQTRSPSRWQPRASLSTSPYLTVHSRRSSILTLPVTDLVTGPGVAVPLQASLGEQGGAGGGQERAGAAQERAPEEIQPEAARPQVGLGMRSSNH